LNLLIPRAFERRQTFPTTQLPSTCRPPYFTTEGEHDTLDELESEPVTAPSRAVFDSHYAVEAFDLVQEVHTIILWILGFPRQSSSSSW
jgi:hypothetical protein